jgi:predicted RNA-binding protein with PIN domain
MVAVMAAILFVDGHSAVFSDPFLSAVHAELPRKARQDLVDWLGAYQDATETSVVVVFDGSTSQRHTEGGTEGEVLVVYSEAKVSADAVIEELAAQQAGKHEVTVASNDRLVLDGASAHGASAVSITNLREEVDRVLSQFRRQWGISRN